MLDVTGVINLPLVYVMSLVLGVANAFDNPARRSLVTELVPPEEITNATSLNTAVMTSSRVVGPALGAVLVGVVGTGVLLPAQRRHVLGDHLLAHGAADRRDVPVAAAPEGRPAGA